MSSRTKTAMKNKKRLEIRAVQRKKRRNPRSVTVALGLGIGCTILSVFILSLTIEVSVRVNDDLHSFYLWDSTKEISVEHKQSSRTGIKMSKSLSILMAEVQNVDRPIPDDDDKEFRLSVEKNRCAQFESLLKYGGKTKRRRIFAGGLIADDSWHVIGANALETYGIFHSVAFIESNRTQSFEPRPLRFTPGSEELRILQSGIYGPNTPVYVENFVYEQKEIAMTREHMMRQTILEEWKRLGMTREDIGIIFDVDEVPSRDFLRAAQICDPPEEHWRSDYNQTCRSPMIRLSFPMFEGSPKCIHKGNDQTVFKRFVSSSMVIGACIEGIGDSDRHTPALREKVDVNGKVHGGRKKGYGRNTTIVKYQMGRTATFHCTIVQISEEWIVAI